MEINGYEIKPFANLQDANLEGADLRGANLYGANLQGANLRYANLRDANLRSADLYGADLYGANLQYANLRNANLEGADLEGAIVTGTILEKKEEPQEDTSLSHKNLMSKFYTKLSGTDVIRSKIDVFTMSDPNDEKIFHRVELTADNDGVFITSCEGNAREDMSIGNKDLAIAVARGILEAYGEV